ncbi:hypothetical protein LCGC14_2159410 [marine sediment metagenome]|uniref:Uncharacterized protein n=1 Tax=marine sediment metagenome TaxID=412755 RepID=A0A0F9G643_9ZZZZ
MAEIKVEHTAEGREIIYHVHVHPEVFQWLAVEELIDKLADQFREHLDLSVWDMKKEVE